MSEKKSFFQTLPGILTGLAALISAITGLYIAFHSNSAPPAATSPPTQTEPAEPSPASPPEIAELTIQEFTFTPMPPKQSKPVRVTAVVRNSGNSDARNVLIKWWPGVNFPDPLMQNIPLVQKGGTKKVVFNYPGYRSWYGKLETKVVVNPNNAIVERDYKNNILSKKIPVHKITPSVSPTSTSLSTPVSKPKIVTPPATLVRVAPTVSAAALIAELSIDSFRFNPMPPTQKKPVMVTAVVRNSGRKDARNVQIKWWPGVNFPEPLTQNIPLVQKGGTKKVVFKYSGYRSWYGKLESKMVVNSNKATVEKKYTNNTVKKKIAVRKPGS